VLRLVVHLPLGAREVPLEGAPVSIGRAKTSTVPIENDGLVSREHCRIERGGERWVLLDLGSQNGTRMGAGRIAPNVPVPLRAGMHFFVGRVRVDVKGESVLARLVKLLGLGALFGGKKPAGSAAPAGTMKCPRCGALINIAKRSRGTEVGCPRCRSVYRVP